MEPISLTILAAFIGSCLTKGGEKISEKIIVEVFARKKELAERVLSFFKPEIISLGLHNSTPEEIRTNLISEPEIIVRALKKLLSAPELVEAFNIQLKENGNSTVINCDKIGLFVQNNSGTINQTINY